jgi:subfamily B ATP-binding cassette protein MsbA
LNRDDKPYLKDGETQFETFNDVISLNNLTFHYDQSEPAVLGNISIKIPKDQFTAVVGPSGGGKSTLVNLIARLYDCQEGSIMVDGVDLKQLDIASWRTKLAVVSQDSFVFNDTVWSNLRFADQSANDEQIIQAAKLANAHKFINELPEKYDTILGDRGVRLSGGQQQRIAIARAMLADPQLLILDEATSSLDSETERAIQNAIEQFGSNRTVLAIAHRLSTIRAADNIIVLDGGEVVQQGTHDMLMQQGGLYQKLVQMQQLEEASQV